MILLAFSAKQILLMVGQLLLSLSILVVLHEFGHYITAKWFKCRVEKFFLFFDPWFALFKKKVGETVYGIGWLPLGGYVKISGMIDESMDKEQMKLPPQPWEFRSKPAWQRLIVMLGGVIMNILTAFVIYAFILMIWGDKKIPSSSMKYGVHVGDSTLLKYGFRSGDKIIGVDGKEVYDLTRFKKNLITGSEVELEREGKRIKIDLPQAFIGELIENKKRTGFIEPRIPTVVRDVEDTSRAYKAGLRPGDYIVGIDSSRFLFYDQMSPILEKKKNQEVLLTVQRNGSDTSFSTRIYPEGQIGFGMYNSYKQLDSLGWLKLEIKKYNFFPAFPAGVRMTITELRDYVAQFKKILNPNTGAYKGVSGFKGMARLFDSESWNWESFWRLTALLSVILAFMNLLPIPGLDGGHVMFTLWEMITGRKPSDKFMEYAQIVGFVILVALMLYANGNDWFGWGK